MTATIITGTYNYTYTLAAAHSPLTVAASATINVVAGTDPIGLYSDAAGVSLTNEGHISAYQGYPKDSNGSFSTGGAGVDLAAGGTVTNGGDIAGGEGFYGKDGGAGVSLSGGTVNNASTGNITGGYGSSNWDRLYTGNGGAGVDLTAAGTVTNHGNITGGTGGYSGAYSGTGGAGVVLAAGSTLSNSANITGGVGGVVGFISTGSGGVGVDVSTGDTVTNTAQIAGGAGGPGVVGYSYPGGTGGAGVYLNGGTVTTSGTISGGKGGMIGATPSGAAGDAVQFGSVAGTLVIDPGAAFNGQVAANTSVNDILKLNGTESQSEGARITLGTQFTGFSTLDFAASAAWTVDVGAGAAPSGGLTVKGFTTSDKIDIMNLTPSQVTADFNYTTEVLSSSDGTLLLAAPPSHEAYLFLPDGSGGTDISLISGDFIATTVNASVTLGSKAHPSPLTITNIGVVEAPNYSGANGVLSSVAGNILTNAGIIDGGQGASTGQAGGSGVIFRAAGTLSNTGSISGGRGGMDSTASGGAGGVGVSLDGGTLTSSGTISGGVGGNGVTAGAAGDAVKFGTVASTLVVDPGAVFNGQVVANASVNDVLELGGTQSGGTAITLGTQFTNFSTLDFAPGATGTVDATKAALSAPHMLTIDGFGLGDTLDITNMADSKGTTLSFNVSTEILTITKGASVVNLGFNSAFAGDHFVLSAHGAGSDLTLQSGAAANPASVHGLSLGARIDRGLTHAASIGLHT